VADVVDNQLFAAKLVEDQVWITDDRHSTDRGPIRCDTALRCVDQSVYYLLNSGNNASRSCWIVLSDI